MIVMVLGLLWLMQISFVVRLEPAFSYGALIMSMALISIIGGRITPAFSSGWLRQRGLDGGQIKVVPALDVATLASMVLLMAALVSGWQTVTAILAATAAVLMLVRLGGWKGWLFRTEPLLWMLHLAILWVPVALLLLAGSILAGWPGSAWAHAAGTGAIGCLVLGVIARVTLGHTGRPLVLPGGMVTAFIMIQLAALVRVITAFDAIPWSAGTGISALLWVLAFGVFLVRYARMLASPRADGKAG